MILEGEILKTQHIVISSSPTSVAIEDEMKIIEEKYLKMPMMNKMEFFSSANVSGD